MNGTYTQRRRRQMAGGGIMGSNAGSMLVAPTADGSRPGYGGPLDFLKDIKDKFVDDIIPNEIKESPVGAALVGGALLNQFGLPDIIPGAGTTKGMGQNWLGNLLGGVTGSPVDTVLNPSQWFTGGISGMDDAGLDPNWKTA